MSHQIGFCTILIHMLKTASDEARIVFPGQLIGSVTVCALLGIDRSTLVRRIQRGDIVPLAQLDGATGAYVFDRFDFPEAQR